VAVTDEIRTREVAVTDETDEISAHALHRRGGEAQTIGPAWACAWTAIEMVNDVYLLAGAADGSIALFDLVRFILPEALSPASTP
jgi:hypothetical protein